jgi:hypothetical protein
MSSDYLTILQLSKPVSHKQLERAYQMTRARYQRLTSRGPLRFYRQDLLDDAEKAYRMLKDELSSFAVKDDKYRNINHLRKPPSVVAQQAAKLCSLIEAKGAVNSPIKKGTILSSEPLTLKSRTLNGLRQNPAAGSETGQGENNDCGVSKREKALIEDGFCREVIHRLEGEMIRFDSRRELLQVAQGQGISLFRANMLIAQIVEAVRQNKLYEPSSVELEINGRNYCRNWRLAALLAAGAVLAAVVIDVLVIRYLG